MFGFTYLHRKRHIVPRIINNMNPDAEKPEPKPALFQTSVFAE
jgi:hypothetical protein